MSPLEQQQVALSVLQQQLTQCKEPGSGWATKTAGRNASFSLYSHMGEADSPLVVQHKLTTCSPQHHK
jgi:hypothetical protein